MEDKDRFVDELLDSALAHHRDAEPRAGLEGRILAHVRTAQATRSRTNAWKLCLAAAAATAAVLALVAIYEANHTLRPVPQASQAANTAPAPSPTESLKANLEPAPAAASVTKVVEPPQIARRERKPPRHVEAHHWPSQFPTPVPLSAEEKALLQYVHEASPEMLAEPPLMEQATLRAIEIKPLKIKPLKIKPLELGTPHDEIP